MNFGVMSKNVFCEFTVTFAFTRMGQIDGQMTPKCRLTYQYLNCLLSDISIGPMY